MLARKNILLISPEPWNHIHVSKHHYAKELARRGNKVYFLNPPSNEKALTETDETNLFIVDYKGFIKGMSKLPKLARKSMTLSSFKKLEKQTKVKFDVIWSFDNSVFYDFDALPLSVLKISHIVDLNMDFQFSRAAQSADICFGNTSAIVNKLMKINPNTQFINHGFSENELSEEITIKSDKIKIGYAGNLDIRYLDWELLRQCFSIHPEVDFYLAGSMIADYYIGNFTNVHHLGILSKANLMSFYSQMDLLIIVYQADTYKDQLANPHKVMEYLASGKPIVATYTSEYDGMGLLEMSNSNSDFHKKLSSAIDNLDALSSEEQKSKRIAFAMSNTYAQQIERIEKIIQGNE